MTAAIAIALGLIAAAFALARLIRGPRLQDRAVAAQALMLVLAVVLAALAGAAGLHSDAAAWIDLAILAVICASLVSLAVLKAVARRSLQPALAPLEERR